MLLTMEEAGDEERLELHRDVYIPHYLRNAFQYFGDVFRIYDRTNPLADAAKLEEIVAAGTKFYEADTKARGLAPYYSCLQNTVTMFSAAAMSASPKSAVGDTGATAEAVTVFCESH